MTAATISEVQVERLTEAFSSISRRGTLARLHRRLQEECDVDLDRARYLVLRQVAGDGPVRITDLAQRISVEPSTITRHAQALVRRGLVRKSPDPSDARAAVVEVTRAGRRIVDRMERCRRRILSDVLGRWDPDDQERFVLLMERFADDLSLTT